MISYAQNFEDVLLHRVFANTAQGFYVDVGAHHPVYGNVTKTFYDRGWMGVNIEPEEQVFEELRAQRLRDFNHQCCAGSSIGEKTFYEISPSGLSTTKLELAEFYRDNPDFVVNEKQVQVYTLNYILEKLQNRINFEFLKIDVEGSELDVLKGIDLSLYRPKIVIVEGIDAVTRERNDSAIAVFLDGKNYESVWFDGINTFYLAGECSFLRDNFELPPGFLDEFYLHESSQFLLPTKNKLFEAEFQLKQKQLALDNSEMRFRKATKLLRELGCEANVIERL